MARGATLRRLSRSDDGALVACGVERLATLRYRHVLRVSVAPDGSPLFDAARCTPHGGVATLCKPTDAQLPANVTPAAGRATGRTPAYLNGRRVHIACHAGPRLMSILEHQRPPSLNGLRQEAISAWKAFGSSGTLSTTGSRNREYESSMGPSRRPFALRSAAAPRL